MKIQVESKGSVSVLMTQERPGSTARGPQHVMMKLQIYNTSPHFGKGIVSIMMLVRQGSSLRAACAQMGLSYSKAWRLLKSAEADLGIPLLDTQKGGTKRAGSTLTPQGEELLDRYLAFEKKPGRPCLRRLKSISRPTTRSRNKHAKRQCRAALPF